MNIGWGVKAEITAPLEAKDRYILIKNITKNMIMDLQFDVIIFKKLFNSAWIMQENIFNTGLSA